MNKDKFYAIMPVNLALLGFLMIASGSDFLAILALPFFIASFYFLIKLYLRKGNEK